MASFGLTRESAPDESTLRKLFARIDTDAFDSAVGMWMWTRTTTVEGRRVFALDGKTVRGARTRPDGLAPHLIAAFDHDASVVVAQIMVDSKGNEIAAARTLLGQLDLAGVVVTMDAMRTQTDTANLIIGADADYVFTVKRNMPSLHQKLKELPWKDVPATRQTDRGRGKRATRTIKVVDVPAWVDFPGAKQVTQLRRTVTQCGKKTVEVVYLITSAEHLAAQPARLAAWVQGHWGIENRLHYVRDFSYREDESQVRTGHAPQVIATCSNVAASLLRLSGWDNIAASLRHHAADPNRAAKLALT